MDNDIQPAQQAGQPIQTAQKPPLRWKEILPLLIPPIAISLIGQWRGIIAWNSETIFYLVLSLLVSFFFVYVLRWIEHKIVTHKPYVFKLLACTIGFGAMVSLTFPRILFSVLIPGFETKFILAILILAYYHLPIIVSYTAVPILFAKYHNKLLLISSIASVVSLLFIISNIFRLINYDLSWF